MVGNEDPGPPQRSLCNALQVKAEWTLRPNDAKAPKDASEGGIAGVSEVPLFPHPKHTIT